MTTAQYVVEVRRFAYALRATLPKLLWLQKGRQFVCQSVTAQVIAKTRLTYCK